MTSINEKTKIDSGFCDHGPKLFRETFDGPLSLLTLGVKDLFAISGYQNSAGNPDWYRTHEKASKTATAVQQLLNAGIEFAGFTLTDELAFSLEGNNHHYGMSENPKLPGHTCGGSSMGSAAATAGGWVDVGLGTDTGGSVRVPASYCGLYGIRPSHGAVSTEGLVSLAPRFDTVGWLTRNAQILSDIGDVLLVPSLETEADVLCFDERLIQLVSPELQQPLTQACQKLSQYFSKVKAIDLGVADQFSQLADVFRVLQGRAIANYHRHWLESENPSLSSPVQARIDMALALTDSEVEDAEITARAFCKHLKEQLPENGVLFLPTTPTTAPKLGEDTSALRPHLMQLTAIAGLTGSVQIHLPWLPQAGLNMPIRPYGFSLLRHSGNDKQLLALVRKLDKYWNEEDN